MAKKITVPARPPKIKLIKEKKEKDGFEASRVFYWLECAFEYFISMLSSGAFLAKLTSEVGISDSVTAILTALTSLAGVFQLISIQLSRKLRAKAPVTAILFASQMLFAAMFMIPFLPIGKLGMTAIFFAVILLARILATIPSSLKVTWFMNLVPMKNRGMYTAINQIVSLASGAALSFVAGYMIDKFSAANDMQSAFIILSVTIFIFAVIHLALLLLSKEKPREAIENPPSLFGGIKELLHNKLYTRLVIVLLLEAIGNCVITPFLGTYQTKELGFSMTFISVITVVLSAAGMLANLFFGRISQSVRYRDLLKISYPIICVAYIINIFTAPQNGAALFIIYSIVLRIGSTATAVCQTNLVMEISPREQQVAAISLYSIISGLLSFFVTLAVSPFVDFMQSRGNQFLGMTVYAQQLLSALAAVFYLAGALVYFFIFIPAIDGKKPKKKKGTL